MWYPYGIAHLYFKVLSNDISQNEIPELDLQKGIQQMADAYQPHPDSLLSLHRWAANFNVKAHRCAYLHKYAPLHTALVYEMTTRTIFNNPDVYVGLFNQKKLKICSLGGGPGSDVIGLLSALHHQFGLFHSKVTIVDIMSQWKETFGSIVQELSFGDDYNILSLIMQQYLKWSFVTSDLLGEMSRKARNAIKRADIVTMVKFVSAAACLSTAAMLEEIFRTMKPGALVFFIDNASGGFRQLVQDAAIKCQFTTVFGPLPYEKYTMEEFNVTRFGYVSCHSTQVTVQMLMKSFSMCTSGVFATPLRPPSLTMKNENSSRGMGLNEQLGLKNTHITRMSEVYTIHPIKESSKLKSIKESKPKPKQPSGPSNQTLSNAVNKPNSEIKIDVDEHKNSDVNERKNNDVSEQKNNDVCSQSDTKFNKSTQQRILVPGRRYKKKKVTEESKSNSEQASCGSNKGISNTLNNLDSDMNNVGEYKNRIIYSKSDIFKKSTPRSVLEPYAILLNNERGEQNEGETCPDRLRNAQLQKKKIDHPIINIKKLLDSYSNTLMQQSGLHSDYDQVAQMNASVVKSEDSEPSTDENVPTIKRYFYNSIGFNYSLVNQRLTHHSVNQRIILKDPSVVKNPDLESSSKENLSIAKKVEYSNAENKNDIPYSKSAKCSEENIAKKLKEVKNESCFQHRRPQKNTPFLDVRERNDISKSSNNKVLDYSTMEQQPALHSKNQRVIQKNLSVVKNQDLDPSSKENLSITEKAEYSNVHNKNDIPHSKSAKGSEENIKKKLKKVKNESGSQNRRPQKNSPFLDIGERKGILKPSNNKVLDYGTMEQQPALHSKNQRLVQNDPSYVKNQDLEPATSIQVVSSIPILPVPSDFRTNEGVGKPSLGSVQNHPPDVPNSSTYKKSANAATGSLNRNSPAADATYQNTPSPLANADSSTNSTCPCCVIS